MAVSLLQASVPQAQDRNSSSAAAMDADDMDMDLDIDLGLVDAQEATETTVCSQSSHIQHHLIFT